MIITIDGPAASGKSTIAKKLAQRLGIYYLHTGLLYRAISYLMLQEVGNTKQALLEKLTSITDKELEDYTKNITYSYDDEGPHIFYHLKDITPMLEDAAFDQPASIVSANKKVRAHLLTLQRRIAKDHDLVADGRDCGSVVFPDAEIKFYLTAHLAVRAQRFLIDEKRKALNLELEKVKQLLQERDERDSSRDTAPLTIPDGAIVIDNSAMSIEETVMKFLSIIEEHRS
jgi:cytidylate kinase